MVSHLKTARACPIQVLRAQGWSFRRIGRELGIKEGETTDDKLFSIESVRCLGCCGLAPVVTVGKNLHGKVPLSKVGKILQQYK